MCEPRLSPPSLSQGRFLDKYLSPVALVSSLHGEGTPERKPASSLPARPHTHSLRPRVASQNPTRRLAPSRFVLACLPILSDPANWPWTNHRPNRRHDISLARPFQFHWIPAV